MPANTSPIFSAKGAIQWNPAILLAANTAKDGTGAVATVFTGNAAGNNAGNFVQRLVARALGTNVATVLRVFINNGALNTTAANNSLIAEFSLPVTTEWAYTKKVCEPAWSWVGLKVRRQPALANC